MLMHDFKTIDVAEVKNVMKNLINDENLLPLQNEVQKPEDSGIDIVDDIKNRSRNQNPTSDLNQIKFQTQTHRIDYPEIIPHSNLSDRTTVRKFSDLVSSLPKTNFRKTQKKDLSVPIMFNLLLHLANDQKLHIKNLGKTFEDLDIVAPNDEA